MLCAMFNFDLNPSKYTFAGIVLGIFLVAVVRASLGF